MKAMGFEEPGGPDVLKPLELPVPEPGPGEVRVRVRAAGVQPYDLAIREGWSPPGTPEGFPRVPGNEFAGVADAVGEGVTTVRPGDEVLGNCRLNAYAEYVTVPAEALTACTVNAACSLGLGAQVGSLEPGRRADFLIHEFTDYRELAYFIAAPARPRVFIAGREVMA